MDASHYTVTFNGNGVPGGTIEINYLPGTGTGRVAGYRGALLS